MTQVILQPASGAGKDVGIRANAPDSQEEGMLSVKLGQHAVDGIARLLIEFDLSSIPSDAIITDATLYLTLNGQSDPSIYDVTAYRVTAAWASTVTWNNQPAHNGTARSTYLGTTNPGNAYELYIDSLVQDWVDGTSPNYGMKLIGQEGTVSSDKTFALSEWSAFDASETPKLVINYNRAPGQPGNFSSPVEDQVVDDSVQATWTAASDPDGTIASYELQGSVNNGGAWFAISDQNDISRTVDTSAWAATSTAKLRVRAKDNEGLPGPWRVSALFTISHNVAPNSPPIVTPKNNMVLDRTLQQVFDWEFSDNDAGDSQSQFQRRYRLAGAGSWTEESAVTATATQLTDSAGFWALGDHEWQVRTADAQGVWGPYSASAFFTAAEAPPTPAITEPINGATISTEDGQVTWNAPAQSHFQVRKVADDAGSPDATEVYYDSGEQASVTARNHALTFPVNDRTEHIQVRIKANGLWSSWASIMVLVDYTTPPVPGVALTPFDSSALIQVEVTNPAPSGTEPPVIHNDIYRRESGQSDEDWERIATSVGVDGIYEDRTPNSETTYEYQVKAIGDNGTSSESLVSSSSVTLRYSWVHLASDPTTLRQFQFNNAGGSEQYDPLGEFLRFAGRKYPVVEFGEHVSDTVVVDLELAEDGDIEYMRDLARLRQIVCYRDSSGRKIFGIIDQQVIQSRFYGGSMALPITAVDYSEEV